MASVGFCLCGGAQAATQTWNVATEWGVTQSGIASGITAARNHFAANPGDTVILHIPAGTYSIGGSGSYGIDLWAGMHPGSGGRFILEGEGMGNTTLVFTDTDEDQIYGRNLEHVTFRGMHMTRSQYTASQGTVVEVGNNYVDLDIHPGYPVPSDIIRWSAPQGLYLRRYLPNTDDPQIIADGNNQQVAWETSSYQIAGQRWRMLHNAGVLSNYKIGEYVGIKSKHTGNTYYIIGSSDIVFENMKWTHSTRGVLRLGVNDVLFTGCRIERSAPINGIAPCMASSAGGPQMNQPSDALATNMVVENCYIDGTGDDCVAFFHVDGGEVRNCEFRDSFARGILLTEESLNVVFSNTTVTRGPIQGSSRHDDTLAPSAPAGLGGVDMDDRFLLEWAANTDPDLHYYQVYREHNGAWWEYAMTTETQYDDLWASAGENYNYYIEAVDCSGNHSSASAIIRRMVSLNFGDIAADGTWSVDGGTTDSYTLGAFGQTTQLLTFAVSDLSLDSIGTADDSLTVRILLSGSDLITQANTYRWGIQGIDNNRINADESLTFSFADATASLGAGGSDVAVEFEGFTGLSWEEQATGDWYWVDDTGTNIGSIAMSTSTNLSFAPSQTFAVGGCSGSSTAGRVFNLAFTLSLTDLSTTRFGKWAASFDLAGTDMLPAADPDADTFNNLYEYGMGGDPTNPAVSFIMYPVFEAVGGVGSTFDYVHPRRTDDDSLRYSLEVTDDLVSGVWTNSGGHTEIGTNAISAEFEAVTNRITTLGKSNEFIRLRFEM